MPVESLECPQCGAPVPVDSATRIAVCPYCHTVLRVTRTPSGKPTAVLDEIREETGILARRAALVHMQERLVEINQERMRLRRVWEKDIAAVTAAGRAPLPRSPWATAAIIAGSALFVFSLFSHIWRAPGAIPGAIIGLAVLLWGTYAAARRSARLLGARNRTAADAFSRDEEAYGSRILALDEEAREFQDRIAAMKAEMDRLTKELR